MPRLTLEQKSVLVLNYLDIGKDNATSRAMLGTLTGFSDRDIRQAIELLRGKSVPVCSTCHDNTGYWIADNEQELETYLNEYLAHARTMEHNARAMRKAFEPKNQIEMEAVVCPR